MNDELQKRNEYIAEGYMEGLTADQLGREHGLSVPCIRKILKTMGVNAKQRQEQGRRLIEAQPITAIHKRLGDRFYFYYKMELKMTRKAVAAKLGWTVQKCASVERGVFDVTLLDLNVLSSFMKLSISEVCACA